MKIRRIDIENFRGVRTLSWRLPADQTFYVLIGPGDATKSTILTAIERALSDRWNITFTDTDFYDADIDKPIRIRVAVSDLPKNLLGLDELGLHLAGIDTLGDWTHDAVDGTDKCVIVELLVEADLEPQWTIYRPGQIDDPQGGQHGDVEPQAEPQHPLLTRHRAYFGAFRVDERVDTHLRWSRMSALGKLTAKKNDAKHTLTAARRAAREAASNAVTESLQSLANDVGAAVRSIGSADFDDLRPGLDLSLGSAQGNLALFNGRVPLMNYGLGTRRLAGAAAQQLAHDNSTILLVDEVEYGLEPHRLVHLLRHLRKREAFAQVFVTTHSPTALQHLAPSDLIMVRSTDGLTSVRCLGEPDSLKPVIKSTPEAFLARRVVIGEGKTEYGLLLALTQAWDDDLLAANELPAAALGVVSAEGSGGVGTLQRAEQLRAVGYDVIVLLDSDDVEANDRIPHLEAAGGKIVRWPGKVSVEQAVCNELDVDGLTALLAAAVTAHDGDSDDAANAVSSQLTSRGAPATSHQLNVASWLTAGTSLHDARVIIGLAAKKSGWFKDVDKGKRLAEIISTRAELQSGDVAATITQLRTFIYEKPAPEGVPAASLDASGSEEPPGDQATGDETAKA